MRTTLSGILLFGANLFTAVFVYAGGNPSNGGTNCIDSSLISPGTACPAVYAPVCGCDGITYSNDCEALANGVTSFTTGTCSNGGPDPNDSTIINDCVDSSLIDPSANCPTVYNPVCGCDGITYDNDCIAFANGVVSYFYGVCSINPGDSTNCFPPYFYYTFNSAGQTVSFMYSTYTILPDGTISGDSNNIQLGAPNGVPTPPSFSVVWDFGDGTTSTDVNPVHTYADSASGSYIVCLTVIDSLAECSAQYCEVIYNYNSPCDASFDWIHDPANDSIIFINNTPGLDDSAVVIWSFGDGAVSGSGINDSTGVNSPGYIYGSDGIYVPCLTVYNPATGCFAMVCDTIFYSKNETGIADNDKAQLNISLYPNPATDKVRITLTAEHNTTPIKISVVDLAGKILSRFSLNPIGSNNNTFEWNTLSLANGLYVICAEGETSLTYKRLSVIH